MLQNIYNTLTLRFILLKTKYFKKQPSLTQILTFIQGDLCFYTAFKSYIRSLKLKYCLRIGLSDNQDCLRCILSLDRTRDVPYEQEDIHLIKYPHPLINHLHINLFIPQQNFSQKNFSDEPACSYTESVGNCKSYHQRSLYNGYQYTPVY